MVRGIFVVVAEVVGLVEISALHKYSILIQDRVKLVQQFMKEQAAMCSYFLKFRHKSFRYFSY